MTSLFLDFESRSEISLPDRGLDNYLKHKSTLPLMLAYAFGDGPVELWQRHINGGLPPDLFEALQDPSVKVIAFNAPFEKGIFEFCYASLGLKEPLRIPYNRWADVLIWARHLSVTGDLAEVGEVFGLPQEESKLKEGKRLIDLFCSPGVAAKESPLFGEMPAWFHDWDSDPADWERFCNYCRQDVVAERALFCRMQSFPLPETEQKGWELDQVINARGLPLDMELVSGSKDVAERIKAGLRSDLISLTGVENPNSDPQMLKWLEPRGYDFSGVAKPFVNRALAGECDLTDEAIKALNIRKQYKKTSDSKLIRMVDCVSDDGRLRHQFLYMGAARTGRWSGGGGETKNVQMQNLPRPVKEVAKNLDLAISLLKNRDHLGIEMEFPSPMDVVTSTLRSTIKASPGKKLIVCDLNAVEFRVLGWITGDEAINSVFRTGRDPYKDFGADLFQKPYEEITKEERQNAKPGVLGGGYQLSGGEEYTNEEGDKVFSGLMGYARSLQIEIDHDLAHESIAAFRAKYARVKKFWYEIENAGLDSVRNPGKVFEAGPFTFQCFGTKLLRIMLPSGRGLHYIRPKIAKNKFDKWGVEYWGKDQKTKQWCYRDIYGGAYVENTDQAFSRDLLLGGLFRAEAKGLMPVGSTHDEIICEVDKASKYGLPDLVECMTKPFDWCPDLLLGAEGYETDGPYRKD